MGSRHKSTHPLTTPPSLPPTGEPILVPATSTARYFVTCRPDRQLTLTQPELGSSCSLRHTLLVVQEPHSSLISSDHRPPGRHSIISSKFSTSHATHTGKIVLVDSHKCRERALHPSGHAILPLDDDNDLPSKLGIQLDHGPQQEGSRIIIIPRRATIPRPSILQLLPANQRLGIYQHQHIHTTALRYRRGRP